MKHSALEFQTAKTPDILHKYQVPKDIFRIYQAPLRGPFTGALFITSTSGDPIKKSYDFNITLDLRQAPFSVWTFLQVTRLKPNHYHETY